MSARRFVLWFCLFVLLLPVVIIGLVGSVEYYTYFTRSESKALADAQQVFLQVCQDQQLDPRTFKLSPSIINKRSGAYMFIWTRSAEETITVSVSYLPYDLPYSISEALVERRIK